MGAAGVARRRPGLTAWVYVVLGAVAIAIEAITEAIIPPRPADIPLIGWLGVITGPAPILAAAAFHARHPTAWSSARVLSVALAALAFVGLLGAIVSIEVVVGRSTNREDPIRNAYLIGGVGMIPALLGGLLLALGLWRTRGRVGRRGGRLLAAAVWAMVGIGLVHLAAIYKFYVDLMGDPTPYLGLITLVTLTPPLLVSGILTTVLVVGAWARERPSAGWWLAGTSNVLLLAATIALPIARVFTGPVAIDLRVDFIVDAVTGAIAAALFIAAFVVGLPALVGKPSTVPGHAELAPVG